MISFESMINIVLCIAISSIIIYFLVYFFFKKIFLPYKKELIDLDFETALFILKTIINTELDAYENDIFMSKGSITNGNFENYYKDITSKIINNISADLLKHLSLYITEDMVYVIVARSVKKFLTEKITGTV